MSNQGDQVSRISLRTPKFDDAPQSVKVYEDSIVRFSKRVNFDVGCQMNFTNYPVDNQTCEVKFESFSYQISVTINFSFKVNQYIAMLMVLCEGSLLPLGR